MRRIAIVACVAVLGVACSNGGEMLGLLASSQGSIGIGEQRILVSVIDPTTNDLVATPDITPVATLRDEIGSPLGEYQGEFLWVIPDVHGIYEFDVEIPGPATYQLTVDAGELGELAPIGFVATDDPIQVQVGEEAPESVTRTLDDTDLADLTSDPDPSPAFYGMTVAEAVVSGPAVVLFATPAWCTSQSCGPMLDQVKAIAPEFPDVDYVHVEVYENIHVSDRTDLVLVPAVEEWGLPTEPWLYVIDADGVVASAFEGAISDEDLRTALEAVTG